MSAGEAALASWPACPWLMVSLIAAAIIYLRGYRVYRGRDPSLWPFGRPAAFAGGLAAVFLAFASPIEPFASLLLSVHMVQHVLLMMVAPPLFWFSTPLLPLVRGLPGAIRTYWVAPLFQSNCLRRLLGGLVQPVPALIVFVVVTWAWHVPRFYDLAAESPGWHFLQHACFFISGLIFWFPVIRPYPYRPTWSVWLLFPYLLLADLANTALSALLTFAPTVLYPHYALLPPIGGGASLEDQAVAGGLMWALGSVAYLLPLAGIGLNVLQARSPKPGTRNWETSPDLPSSEFRVAGSRFPVRARIPLPLLGSTPPRVSFDLLRLPLVGSFLRWRHARLALQSPMFALAAAVVVDGFMGPDIPAMNLAGVLVWVLWRGLLVLVLVVGGNFLCMACPFQLPRTLSRRLLPAGWHWPRALRGKWLALGLLVAFFTIAEALTLWEHPRWTAWIVLVYFAAAFLVDGLFRGAAFCKYVCPIGQFSFVQSLVSPLEIGIRDPQVCVACKTKDCIRGRDRVLGCELDLFQPRKRGNMDCTFCFDCIHACPHGNIGIIAGAPGRGLDEDPPRSGIGQFGRRPDLAVLAIVLVFAAFANAAMMVEPVLASEANVQRRLGLPSPRLVIVSLYLLAALVLPLFVAGLTAWASRGLSRLQSRTPQLAMRFAPSLVPLGLGMWLAHYGYHLATGYGSVWPTIQRFAADLGWSALGEPLWAKSCCAEPGPWVLKAQLVALDLGLLLSLYVAYHTARNVAGGQRGVMGTFLPWAILIVSLFSAGVWIVMQPMVMM